MHTTVCSSEAVEVGDVYFQCLVLQKSQNRYGIVVTMGQRASLGYAFLVVLWNLKIYSITNA